MTSPVVCPIFGSVPAPAHIDRSSAHMTVKLERPLVAGCLPTATTADETSRDYSAARKQPLATDGKRCLAELRGTSLPAFTLTIGFRESCRAGRA